MGSHEHRDSRLRRSIATTTAVVTGAAAALALAVPTPATARATTVVDGTRLGAAGLEQEHVDCTTPEVQLGDGPSLRNVLDEAAPRGPHVATWPLRTLTRGIGATAAVPDPADLTELSIDVRAIDAPVVGAAVVRWQPAGSATSWVGLATLPSDAVTTWHTVDAATRAFRWTEITDDGRAVGTGGTQTIANFFVGRDDSAGARVGFVFGCNDAPFLVDDLVVTSPTTDAAYDFEATTAKITFDPTRRTTVYGRVIRGVTSIRTSSPEDTFVAAIERSTPDGPVRTDKVTLEKGKDRWAWSPKQSGSYRVRLLDQDSVRSSPSDWVRMHVQQRVNAKPGTRSVKRDGVFSVSGIVKPAVGTRVSIQRLGGNGWVTVTSKAVSAARWSMKVRATVAGSIRYRAVAAATEQNDKGTSSVFVIDVIAPPKPSGGGTGGGGGGTGGGGGGTGGGGGGGEDPPDGPQRPTA